MQRLQRRISKSRSFWRRSAFDKMDWAKTRQLLQCSGIPNPVGELLFEAWPESLIAMRKAQREEADNALDELEAADDEYEWLIREANLPGHLAGDDD